jgi:phage portal protein BeeE
MINIFNAINKLFKSRDKPKNVTVGSAYNFLFGGSTAGKMVTERSSMQMTAVYSCVRILAEAVAGLPLHLYKYTDSGGKERQWTISCIFSCMMSQILK